MFWLILLIFLLVLVLAVVVFYFVHDRSYAKKDVVETMDDKMWDEISAERDAALGRRRKFRKTLKDRLKE